MFFLNNSDALMTGFYTSLKNFKLCLDFNEKTMKDSEIFGENTLLFPTFQDLIGGKKRWKTCALFYTPINFF